MKGKVLAGIAALTLFDIARAHAQVPALPNWFGYYVGAHAGYRWGHVNADIPVPGLPSVFPGTPGTATFPQPPFSTSASFHPRNATGGLLWGLNSRWGAFGLVGWEADVTWGKGTSSTGYAATLAGLGTAVGNFSATLDWAASFRFRAGYVTGPWLFYGTAGVSVQRVNISGVTVFSGASSQSVSRSVCTTFDGLTCLATALQSSLQNSAFSSLSAFSLTKNLIGPVIGFGGERILGNNFTVRIEYLAAFYDRETFGNVAINNFYSDNFVCNCAVTSTTIGSLSAMVRTQTLRIALTARIP